MTALSPRGSRPRSRRAAAVPTRQTLQLNHWTGGARVGAAAAPARGRWHAVGDGTRRASRGRYSYLARRGVVTAEAVGGRARISAVDRRQGSRWGDARRRSTAAGSLSSRVAWAERTRLLVQVAAALRPNLWQSVVAVGGGATCVSARGRAYVSQRCSAAAGGCSLGTSRLPVGRRARYTRAVSTRRWTRTQVSGMSVSAPARRRLAARNCFRFSSPVSTSVARVRCR